MSITRRIAAKSLVLLLAGCGLSQPPQSPNGSPPTLPQVTQPLGATPFVPTMSGHRLAVAGDVAIALDPDGPNDDGKAPQIFLASLASRAVLATLRLPDGANPRAVVVASDNTVYVVAEGLGGVYAVDVESRVLGTFTPLCPDPIDAATRGTDLLVACRGGEVVTLNGQGISVQQLDVGLSQIAVDVTGTAFVATQSADVINLSTLTTRPTATLLEPAGRTLVPNTPRRLVPLPTGGFGMLYQQSLTGELTLRSDGGTGNPDDPFGATGYTGGDNPCQLPATRPALTTVGTSWKPEVRWLLATLPIDMAVKASSTVVNRVNVAVADPSSGRVMPLDDIFDPIGTQDVCQSLVLSRGLVMDAPTALAFSDTSLVVLNAGGNLELATLSPDSWTEVDNRILLRSRLARDGFTLFHSDPRIASGTAFGFGPVGPTTLSSVTCASCHPDGLTNGTTTTLFGVTHRVMPLAGHLANAPLVHWDALSFHDAVGTHTWQQNMGGPPLSLDQEASLRAYVAQLQMPKRPTLAAPDLAAGVDAFDKAGCATCHVPSTGFTNGSTADVGRGVHKVPSLIGLVYTAPYMSDGCAKTLEQRFDDVACGGASHGNVTVLSATERSALISYLKTL